MPDTDYPVYESSEVSAREVMDLLRRRRWTVLITLAVFVAVGAFMTSQTTPIYRSRATMIVEQSPARSPRMADGGPMDEVTSSAQPHSLGTQVEVLQSGPLQAKVIDQLRLTSAEAYPGMMVAQVGDTDIIEVVAQSSDPRVAQNAPNLLVAEYIRQSQHDKGASLRKAREYVERKLAEAQEQLASADARLRAFKEQHQIPDLNSSLTNAVSQANSIREELRKAENELTSLHSQIREVSAQVAREPFRMQASRTTIPNPEIDRLNTEIQRLRQQRITLVRTYEETEPEVRQVDAQIRALQRELAGQPRHVQSSETQALNPARATLQDKLDALRVQARGLEPQVALLRGQFQRAQSRLSTFPAWETRLTQLQRERDLRENEQRELSTGTCASGSRLRVCWPDRSPGPGCLARRYGRSRC
jgi:succinoglycan biosynthesis transport protein ExoP